MPPKAGRPQDLVAYLSGPVTTAEFRILSRNGALLETLTMKPAGSEYQGVFTPPAEPFRIAVEGKDAQGSTFRRVHPPLFEGKP